MTAPPAYPFPSPPLLDLPPQLRTLRDRPAMQVTLPSGDTVWLVTRYEDVRRVLADSRLSRNLNRPDAPRMAKDNMMFQDPNIGVDPPDHTRQRRLIAKTFTAARVERLRPHTAQVADELLNRMAAGGPPVDLHTVFTFPLTMRTICGLLGVPSPDLGRFRHWTDAFLSVSKYSGQDVDQARGELFSYIQQLIADKRQNPGDDLISGLIAVNDQDPEQLSEYELLFWSMALLMAGYETTANMLGMMVVMLLTHPDQLAKVQADRTLVPAAVEEMLRLHFLGPSIGMLRYVTDDIDVGGVTIPRGSGVIPALESANLDDTVFDDPWTMDVTRPNNYHLSFSSGPHFCAGSALARMELQVALERLLQRFPSLQLAVEQDELNRNFGNLVEGFIEVPVSW